MPVMYPLLSSSSVIRKRETPVMVPADLPYPSTLVFNAGVVKYRGEYVLIFRNDYGTDRDSYENRGVRFAGTSIGIARSKNGIDGWVFDPEPLTDSAKLPADGEIERFYDPRITLIEGRMYLSLAMDTRHGLRGCIAVMNDDLTSFDIISASVPDNRNMVLFPQRIGGNYYRLERPMPVYSRGRDRFDMWISQSPDLVYWGKSGLVAGVEDFPYANDKIGPAAPPLLTEKGWLVLTHGVDIDFSRGKNGWEKSWQKRYCAGAVLLDRDNPYKVLSILKEPLIAPELPAETDGGFRENVIFPCSMLLEDDGTLRIYYGAADTCVCLAEADLNDVLALFG